jgi:thiopurine S-methyltransferase
MDAQFWINAWLEGRTAFHQSQFNDQLLAHFPKLSPERGQSVFVPLCGKSKDLRWLRDQGLKVLGIELYKDAVAAFFPENAFPAPTITRHQEFVTYESNGVTIDCGDFLKFERADSFDLAFDRAALVALPESMREAYAHKVQTSLRTGGKCLLITYEYDPREFQGPPFSVDEVQVRKLYDERCDVRVLERREIKVEGSRLAALPSLREAVYEITKKR